MPQTVDERSPEKVWEKLCIEASAVIKREPVLASYIYNCVLTHDSLGSALSVILANKLADEVMSAVVLRELLEDAFQADQELLAAASADIRAVFERDAATDSYLRTDQSVLRQPYGLGSRRIIVCKITAKTRR